MYQIGEIAEMLARSQSNITRSVKENKPNSPRSFSEMCIVVRGVARLNILKGVAPIMILQLTFYFLAQLRFFTKIISQFHFFLFQIHINQGLIGCDVFWLKSLSLYALIQQAGVCAARNGQVLRRSQRTMVKG